MKNLIITIFICLTLFSSCSNRTQNREKVITVSILPIKFLAESILGNDFEIKVLVPPGSSPETYEPTPRQIINVNNSIFTFTTGLLGFETEITHKISNSSDARIVNLSKGIDLTKGSCGHTHHNGHHHGVDPHIWTSPKELLVMAENIFEAINIEFPDSVKYRSNYNSLRDAISATHHAVENLISTSDINHFLIYHPALTYLAANYGLTQLSIEEDGKEPSAEKMQKTIDLARRESIQKILYQQEFSRSVVETIAKDLGAGIVVIDPLKENVLDNIIEMVNIITNG